MFINFKRGVIQIHFNLNQTMSTYLDLKLYQDDQGSLKVYDHLNF